MGKGSEGKLKKQRPCMGWDNTSKGYYIYPSYLISRSAVSKSKSKLVDHLLCLLKKFKVRKQRRSSIQQHDVNRLNKVRWYRFRARLLHVMSGK